MQHCNQPIYSNDKFCGHCGDSVDNSNLKVKGIEQVSPEAMQELRNVYPGARVVSGKVVSTYYYKRKFVNNNNNLIYGYWWIELQDEKGNIEATSIEAEDEFFNSIQKGDILTLLYPCTYTLNYRIADSAARKIVKHNESALCVINHQPTQQRSIRGGALNPPGKSTAWMWFVMWIAVAAGLYFGLRFRPTEYAIGAGAIAALICYLFERQRNQKKYEQGQHRFAVLKQSMSKMLNVSRDDLGYHLEQRPTADSDIICSNCNSRIPANLQYCTQCGVELHTEDGVNESIAEQQFALMNEYSKEYSEAYVHKNVMSADEHGSVEIECFMAKVLSKNVESDVSDVSVTTTSTTRTDHYYGRNFSHSTYDTQTRTDRTRDTGISGKVLLQFADGKTGTWQFSEKVLGDLDVGDWVYFSYSDVKVGNKKNYNRECGVNISKNRQYGAQTFAGFGGLTGQGLWIVIGLLFAAWTYSDFREPLIPLLNLTYNSFTAPLYEQRWFLKYSPMLLFAAFNIYLMVHGFIYSQRNAKRQENILAPMRETNALLMRNIKAIQAKISAWS